MKNLIPYDGQLYLLKAFYQLDESQKLCSNLLQSLAWQEEQIFLYGRWVNVARLMCWYGDEGAFYQYSGVRHQPKKWTNSLLNIKEKVERQVSYSFNSVMANLYRDGSDSMGCHADDEKELGENPFIVSLSFGEERLLKFRHIQRKEVINVVLGQGDLLLMKGVIQHYWKHELPKTKKDKTERINLTFRKVVALSK